MENQNKDKGVEITLKMNEVTVSYKHPAWDLGANEIIEGFYGLMVAQTFLPETVLRCMKEFAEEHLPEEDEE